MKFPERFVAPFGTLNTTMVIVTCMCVLQGFFGYLCFGDDILGSITYNIPNEPRYVSQPRLPTAIILQIEKQMQLHSGESKC